MGLNFRKSIKIAPGVRLNFGRKSTGISFGGKYSGVSFNSRTGARARISAPGTGFSYTTKLGSSKKSSSSTNNINYQNNSTNKGGGCLISCLKWVCYLIFLPFAWIYGIYWLLVKRKKLADNPKQQKSKTIVAVVLSVLSLLTMIGNNSSNSSNNAVISTELDTELISSEYINTLTTEIPIETISTEILITEATEINTIIPLSETEVHSDTEDSIIETETLPMVTEKSTQAPEAEKEEVLVWIDDTASRYHKKNGCGMDDAYQVTLDEAISKGKTPCGRCY